MDNSLLMSWSSLVSDTPNALKKTMGTFIWIDGLECLRNLTVNSFFKPRKSLSQNEEKAFHLLEWAENYEFPHNHFWVSGHISLLLHSPYYAHVNSDSSIRSIKYNFTNDEIGVFTPWNGEIFLGTSFYSNYCEQVRIPFYTFNHENTHLIFKDLYSNLPVSDEELYQLIVLIEWYCISLDLILFRDLARNNQVFLLKELNRVPSEKSNFSILERKCHSISSINEFTMKFKDVFLHEEDDLDVYSLVSKKTLNDHRSFTKEVLISEYRKNKSSMKTSDVLLLLKDMKELSLSNLIFKFTGILYE